MKVSRLLKHLFLPDALSRRAFPKAARQKIEAAILESEKQHEGHVRFVVEASLPLVHLFKKRSSRRRAEELFNRLKLWDTEHNSGVLIYVQLVSRHIDIVADRGIARQVPQAEWDSVCRAMESEFREGRFVEGSLEGISRVTSLLKARFPSRKQG